MIQVVLNKNIVNLKTTAEIKRGKIGREASNFPEVFLNINLIKVMGKKPDLPPLFKRKELNEIVDAIHHYYRKMSPRLGYSEKKILFHEMQKHMIANGIEKDTMTEAVPGLKPYWQKDVLSKYEFAMILDCLAYDVFKGRQK